MARLRTIIRVRTAVAVLFVIGGLAVIVAGGDAIFGLLMLAFGATNAVLVAVVLRRGRTAGDPPGV
jgi:hypothetical protein